MIGEILGAIGSFLATGAEAVGGAMASGAEAISGLGKSDTGSAPDVKGADVSGINPSGNSIKENTFLDKTKAAGEGAWKATTDSLNKTFVEYDNAGNVDWNKTAYKNTANLLTVAAAKSRIGQRVGLGGIPKKKKKDEVI